MPEELISEQVNHALKRGLFQQALPSLALGMLTALLCALYFLGRVPDAWLALWCGGIVLTGLLRLQVLIKARGLTDTDLPVKAYSIHMGLTGTVWGCIAMFWSTDIEMADQLILFVLPTVLNLSIVISLGVWPWTYRAFAIGLYVPTLVIMYFMADSSLNRLLAPMTFFFLACMLLANRYQAQLRETLELRIKNQLLVDDLSQQNHSLIKARDEAQDACKTKDEFLARMSHELRTPMNGVLGMSRLLAKTPLQEDQKAYVATLYSSGESMLALVADLLDAASMSSGDTVIEHHAYDFREVLRALEHQHREALNGIPVKLNVLLDEDIPRFLMGDSQRVSQIISKLLSNAVKFTHSGEITVQASQSGVRLPLARRDCAEGQLIITVKDTGVGIQPDKIDKVRELFYQAEGCSTRRHGGTGLGLSIVQVLLELMNGKLDISSERGIGTKVTITLPLLEAGAPEQSPNNNAPSNISSIKAESVAQAGELVQVLVAEDNPVNQLVIEGVLEHLGCQVMLAENGAEALDALQQHSFDIVFMDCQMPELDGYQATREARWLGITVPIIAVTASVLAGDRTRCLNAGMDDYVAKPFSDTDIEYMLDKWVGARRLQLTA